jgi:hypothetical protein
MKDKKLFLAAGVFAASALFASAELQLRLSSGPTTILAVDQGVNDVDPALGVVSYIGAVGGVWLNTLSVGVSKPAAGSATEPQIDLLNRSISTDGSTLTIELTDTDFLASGDYHASIGGTTEGIVTFSTWTDAGNAPFARTTARSSQGPFSGPSSFADNDATTISAVGPYSITFEVTITHPSSGLTGFDAFVFIIPPPPPPPPFIPGDTATIGFWQNKNGQAVIKSMPNSPALGNWLAGNFPCLFGNLANKSNNDVAAQFIQYFKVQGQKTYAQILGGAFATYVTDSDLAGNVAANYGFNVSPTGTGAKLYNVGSLGTAIGLQNNTSYTVFQLLLAADAACPLNSTEFNAFNVIFSDINETGDRL